MISDNKSRRKSKNIIQCPVCGTELSNDIRQFFQHLDTTHFPDFEYLDGHFIFYQNARLIPLKFRNTIEAFCVKIFIHQADKLLKGKKGEPINFIDKCSKCKVSRSSLMKYIIDKKYEFLFCKKCKMDLSKTANFVKIIYNNTGLGKR